MLIYDIEISKAIPPRSGVCEDKVEYCEGWHDHRGMGIAVIGCYDYKTDRYRVFCEDNLTDFGFLAVTQECVVGFNNNRFDDRILEAHGILIPSARSYDILQEIWRALGLGPDFHPATHAGYSLDAMCRANFKTSKTGDGTTAPIQWQRGEIGTVIDYCLNDIHLTKRLLDRIIRTGALANPVNANNTIYLRKPSSKL
jgi:hypothetical protein